MVERLSLRARSEFASRYNIAPGTKIPAVRKAPKMGSRELAELRWGLVPPWTKAEAVGTGLVNARAESLAVKPSFREAFRERRCLIPASGFYEWKVDGRTRQPWLFRRRDEQPFFLAGLWESWSGSDSSVLETCAVITTVPNTLMMPIHQRMPVMLAVDAGSAWLDPSAKEHDLLAMLAHPFPTAGMTACAVSTRVNSVAHDDAECLKPANTDVVDDQQLFAL